LMMFSPSTVDTLNVQLMIPITYVLVQQDA
jgi:hypothetical protein